MLFTERQDSLITVRWRTEPGVNAPGSVQTNIVVSL